MVSKEFKIPELPTFLRKARSDRAVHIKNFTEAELRAIGAAWTEGLILKAHNAREKDKGTV